MSPMRQVMMKEQVAQHEISQRGKYGFLFFCGLLSYAGDTNIRLENIEDKKYLIKL